MTHSTSFVALLVGLGAVLFAGCSGADEGESNDVDGGSSQSGGSTSSGSGSTGTGGTSAGGGGGSGGGGDSGGAAGTGGYGGANNAGGSTSAGGSGGSGGVGGAGAGGSSGSAGTGGSGGSASDPCGGACVSPEICIFQAGGPPAESRYRCAEQAPCGAPGACACIFDEGQCTFDTTESICVCDNGLD